MSSSSNHLLENFIKPDSIKIAVIGLGYVGLPLAIEFAAHYDVIGFDINILFEFYILFMSLCMYYCIIYCIMD